MAIRESVLILVLFLVLQTCHGSNGDSHCAPSSCGKISNISYPFRLLSDPTNCGDLRYNLSCENNTTVLYLQDARLYIQAINYHNFTIRVVDASLDKHELPYFSPFPEDFLYEPYFTYQSNSLGDQKSLSQSIYFVKCQNPVVSPMYKSDRLDSAMYKSDSVDAASCISMGVNGSSEFQSHFCCLNMDNQELSDLAESCEVERRSLFPATEDFNMSFIDVQRKLAFGFELSWLNFYCPQDCSSSCYLNTTTDQFQCFHIRFDSSWESFTQYIQCQWPGKRIIQCKPEYGRGLSLPKKVLQDLSDIAARRWLQVGGLSHDDEWEVVSAVLFVEILILAVMSLVARFICGAPFVIAFLIYKWRRRHLSGYNSIEQFLQNNNNLMPIRYAYSDIKKMTGGFKEKLGEGGFGSVYKGKLRSGHSAAIKMLGKSKSNGQDFINEVATIGRIHHANVVKLIGFCVEGSRRALVYDFMSNGSLDKYLFSRQGYVPLSWEKLYQVSRGVARGIEYLHQGCEMQILHFDIKPHNILLDENFNPKISDFGLAKLYPTKGTIASLTAARGTIGYMAPELFYKNIGRVSYKADVYSFGMLLLEMTGRRKNLNPVAENLTEIYYPFWVYDRLSNEELEIEDVTEEENKVVRKMIITGLWCIQMKPSDRPSINKALEMLEGDLESLQLPPRPVLYPAESITKGNGESSSVLVDSEESSSC